MNFFEKSEGWKRIRASIGNVKSKRQKVGRKIKNCKELIQYVQQIKARISVLCNVGNAGTRFQLLDKN